MKLYYLFMKTNIDYKNKILFIRVNGVLVGNKTSMFEQEIIPIILSLKSRYVSINLNKVDLIDKRGINSLIKISNIVNSFKGKLVLCDLNDYVDNNLKHSDIFDYCFKSKNEKSSREVFKI